MTIALRNLRTHLAACLSVLLLSGNTPAAQTNTGEISGLVRDVQGGALPGARVIAEHNQIQCIGALGLLLLAKQRGKISALAPYVQKLRQSSIFYGDDLLDKVLKLAGE